MQTMEHIFFVLQYIGLWRPVHWQSGWKTKLYHCYTLFVMFAMVIPTFSQLIALIISLDDVEEVAANAFMLLTMMLDCGKASNILIKRNEIIELINGSVQEPCAARNAIELEIQHKFTRLVRSLTLGYGTLVSSVLVIVTLKSLMEDLPQGVLPYKAWVPFDYCESLSGYLIVYTTQILTVCIGSAIGITFDTLLPGLMLHTCAQLNILKQRFHDIPQLLLPNERDKSNSPFSSTETILLAESVRHHLEIFKFAKKSNDMFSYMIFLQCVVSASVLCLCLYRLSELKLFCPEFISVITYMVVMGTQIFLYCSYGCRVTLESLAVGDAIYEIDWQLLSVNGQRSLLTIMARTLKPIEFISGHVVTLNLDSFNKLLKFSYSAYNVLQQTEKSESDT